MLKPLTHSAAGLLLLASLSGCSNQVSDASEAPKAQALPANAQTITVNGLGENWWETAVFYEIWPRSFYDSDGEGSGDINGMTEKLDYLTDLGVNGIWLTPIFEAPSYHGYDFEDFYAIESDYGTMADFENFIAESHKRDIKVILDLVLNHISNRHEWFIKSAKRVPGYEDYFIWKDKRPSKWGRAWNDTTDDPNSVWHWSEERQQYYYGAFGASQPDVNLTNPVVVDEFKKLAKFWLDKGVDGFRLDAVRYAVEDEISTEDADQADTQGTIDYWSDLREYVNSVNPEAVMVAEAWAEMEITGSYWNQGKGVHSAFDFDFGYAVAGLLNNSKRVATFGSVDDAQPNNSREVLWNNLKARQQHAPLSFYSPFLTNHDQTRIMHVLGYSEPKAHIAASLLMTTPGSLYLYYGEEIGMGQANTGDDMFKRAIMQWDGSASAGFNDTGEFWNEQPKWFPWWSDYKGWWKPYWDSIRKSGNNSVAQQAKDENSLLNHYKRLIKVRRAHAALHSPKSIHYVPVEQPDVWLVNYQSADESVWVVVNLNSDAAASFALPAELEGQFKDLLKGNEISLSQSLTLEPAQSLILK